MVSHAHSAIGCTSKLTLEGGRLNKPHALTSLSCSYDAHLMECHCTRPAPPRQRQQPCLQRCRSSGCRTDLLCREQSCSHWRASRAPGRRSQWQRFRRRGAIRLELRTWGHAPATCMSLQHTVGHQMPGRHDCLEGPSYMLYHQLMEATQGPRAIGKMPAAG